MSLLNERLISICLDRIKEQLKTRNISYAKLAEIMDVSEVTVKRMLNQTDISMNRLLTLAEIVDQNLSDLLSEAEKESANIKCFSREQDSAFTEYPYLFQYYIELTVRKKTPEEIAEQYNLTRVSGYRYLRALEKLGLISLQPGDRIQFSSDIPITFPAESKFTKLMMVNSIQQTCDAVLAEDRDQRYTISAIIVPESEFERLVNETSKLLSQFVRTTAAKNIAQEGVPMYQVILAGHPFQMYPDIEIVNVEDGHFD